LFAQLTVNGRVMMSGLLVRVQDIDASLQKKAAQDSFVMRSLGSDGKSGP
jgi:hypothetical protein